MPKDYFRNKEYTDTGDEIFNKYAMLELNALQIERSSLKELSFEGKVSEEIARKIERELDLEEIRLNMEIHY